jgi:hypothetical protein
VADGSVKEEEEEGIRNLFDPGPRWKFRIRDRDKHHGSVTLVIIKYFFKFSFSSRDPLALERAARQYRNAAAVHEASCTWSGQLPPRLPSGFYIYAGIFMSTKNVHFSGTSVV